jgi:hypothetical protein
VVLCASVEVDAIVVLCVSVEDIATTAVVVATLVADVTVGAAVVVFAESRRLNNREEFAEALVLAAVCVVAAPVLVAVWVVAESVLVAVWVGAAVDVLETAAWLVEDATAAWLVEEAIAVSCVVDTAVVATLVEVLLTFCCVVETTSVAVAATVEPSVGAAVVDATCVPFLAVATVVVAFTCLEVPVVLVEDVAATASGVV